MRAFKDKTKIPSRPIVQGLLVEDLRKGQILNLCFYLKAQKIMHEFRVQVVGFSPFAAKFVAHHGPEGVQPREELFWMPKVWKLTQVKGAKDQYYLPYEKAMDLGMQIVLSFNQGKFD